MPEQVQNGRSEPIRYEGVSAASSKAYVEHPDVMTKGAKFDTGKCRMELLPPEMITSVADILTFGAKKYGERNWEKGMSWSRVYGALIRHLIAWWNPFVSDLDEETGKSHLHHAGCCLGFLIAYESRGIGTDDRPEV